MSKKKKSMKEEMDILLKKSDKRKLLCQGLIKSAARGNAQAARLVLKIIGQDPKKPFPDEENYPFQE
ncbi:MAG: hypothetical protein Q4C64_01765 [Erysipelotrichia bacterium]|nr:hypothetical protein [Erysipelotrichia bacterium]